MLQKSNNSLLKLLFFLDIDDEQLVRDGNERIPALPNSYWKHNSQSSYGGQKKCAQYPSIFNLQFSNTYWQILQTSNGTYQLFGAYYDIRNKTAPVVRVLAMIDRVAPTMKIFCQLWIEGQKEAVVVETSKYDYVW